MSGRDLVLEYLDGKLWPSDLTEEGQAFAEAHYDEYLRRLGEFCVDDLDLDNPYYVEDTEKNYKSMAATLDQLWAHHTGAG